MTKSNYSYYVLNLIPSEDLAPMNVMHVLVNRNGDKRSQETVLICGQRATYSNWASKGYLYALKMSRENWWQGVAAITGSWSPDSR